MHAAVKTAGLLVVAVAFGCDRSPTAVPQSLDLTSYIQPAGLVACPQLRDSVTKVIGPKGGYVAVGAHVLFIDSLVLSKRAAITAVAPASSVRWVRFRPDGLAFPTNRSDGWGAILYTSYSDCGLSTTTSPRIAQVSDALGILTYLQTSVTIKQSTWSQSSLFVTALLPHFSNYAVAW